MFGNILSSVVKVATLPLDVVEIAADMATGGSGDRTEMKEVLPLPSELRNKVCEVLEDI